MRLLSCVVCCALFAPFARADDPKQTWVTVKGRVVFPADKDIPKREELKITQDKDHCTKDGKILDEAILVNEKNRGIKNVIVYLRPLDKGATEFEKSQVHPDDAKRKPAEVVIDQPCCMFVKRVTVARPGDTLVVKNPAPVAHNFFWSTDNNGEHNITVPSRGEWKLPQPLAAEAKPIGYSCTIHGWMKGHVRVFDHPYFAVTDADGNFEIRNAPAGKFRIVFWHETGVRGGPEGRFGEEIELKGPTMEMKPTDFEVGAKAK